MTDTKPILVTGSHRSGTTWVGKMIAASPAVGYIHEPFNLTHRPGICTAKFPYWFTYVIEENEKAYYVPLKNTLAFRFNIAAELPAIHSLRHVGRMAKNYTNFTRYRLRHATPLVKDPIALFSAEWLAKRFDMNVIVLIRHPAAFASSIRRLNWRHNFSHFLNQPRLMRDHLAPFEAEIREFAEHEHDILDQATLLWKIIHYMILKYQDAHKDWLFLRHEDMSADPLYYFEYIFKKFNLDFSDHVKQVIQEYTSGSNPTEAQKDHVFTKRDSKANIKSWKKKFTDAEITQLRAGVEDISKRFYSDSEW
jgi:Sulfotransferase family